MLDRLISGAGAVADAADRAVRALVRGGGGSGFARQPGSLLMAAAFAVLAAALVVVGLDQHRSDAAPTGAGGHRRGEPRRSDRGRQTAHVATQYVESTISMGMGNRAPAKSDAAGTTL